MVDWAWAYFTYERSARVVAEPDSRPPSTAGDRLTTAPRKRRPWTPAPPRPDSRIERIREALRDARLRRGR